MGKIYIKTINGRQYRYERISSKRVNGKVVTHDVCRGAVDPVTKQMDRLSTKRISHYRSEYETNFPISSIVEELKTKDGVVVSETTVRNFFKAMGCVRFPRTSESRSAGMLEATKQKTTKKERQEKETQHRFKVLMEEKRLTQKQIVEIGRGKGLNRAMIDKIWAKRG